MSRRKRIGLGIKQLRSDPFEEATSGAVETGGPVRRGAVVTCTVSAVQDNMIEVSLPGGLTGVIRRGDLSRERSEQRPDRFAVGERLDAKVTQIDKAMRRIQLSIKALEIEEEKSAMAQYGTSDRRCEFGRHTGCGPARPGPAGRGERKRLTRRTGSDGHGIRRRAPGPGFGDGG